MVVAGAGVCTGVLAGVCAAVLGLLRTGNAVAFLASAFGGAFDVQAGIVCTGSVQACGCFGAVDALAGIGGAFAVYADLGVLAAQAGAGRVHALAFLADLVGVARVAGYRKAGAFFAEVIRGAFD